MMFKRSPCKIDDDADGHYSSANDKESDGHWGDGGIICLMATPA
jgi:hypothetical protein